MSPAFDINPQPYSDGLKLNISETDNAQSIELVKSVAPYFRLAKHRSDEIINEMIGIIKRWRHEAARLGISASEQAWHQRFECWNSPVFVFFKAVIKGEWVVLFTVMDCFFT